MSQRSGSSSSQQLPEDAVPMAVVHAYRRLSAHLKLAQPSSLTNHKYLPASPSLHHEKHHSILCYRYQHNSTELLSYSYQSTSHELDALLFCSFHPSATFETSLDPSSPSRCLPTGITSPASAKMSEAVEAHSPRRNESSKANLLSMQLSDLVPSS